MDEKIVLKRLKKLIEINKILLELKRAYIKAINPEISDDEVEEILKRWKMKRHY